MVKVVFASLAAVILRTSPGELRPCAIMRTIATREQKKECTLR
ncbi:hypothetical protein OOU_Y34scaffold00516g40 [Pyricularia oryzae Y34]|uniref:Uncharacterized protein n=3 Tax=Pyricularia oryzae TaxID=318829 RepID=A0A4P7NCI2_PYROR|nr:hypothetical protein OOU_Y34scaffold00516g40 [Pyricularia oryzae Y34]QBZ59511.1 hypothetical protein PoMZ_04472 [Pyricularia oryzae]